MKTGKLSRRDFLRLSTLAAAGAALAGCKTAPADAPADADTGSEATAAPPAPDPVKLDYIANWGDKYTITVWDALRQVPEFEEFLGGNEIEVTSIGGDAMTTRVAAGTPPDGASNVDYVQYMSRGMLMDIGS